MSQKLWTKDGKVVVDAHGKPILFEECPCGAPCNSQVDAAARALVESGTHTIVGTYTPGYTCPEWLYDEYSGEWTLVSPASGSLAAAMYEGGTPADCISHTSYGLVYAVTLQSISTGVKTTIGCRCAFDSSSARCVHQAITLEGYAVAFYVQVYSAPQGTPYLMSDACRWDACSYMTKLIDWMGARFSLPVLTEGFVEDYDRLHPSYWHDHWYYWGYLRGILYTDQATTTSTLYYIDCQCTNIETFTLGENDSVHTFTGFCASGDQCLARIASMRDDARRNGYEWHDEGIVQSRLEDYTTSPTTYGAYKLFGGTKAKCAYITSSQIVYLDCNCSRASVDIAYNGCSDYRRYYDYSGACSCVDYRELATDDPSGFGLVDMAWGTDTKIRYKSGSGSSWSHILAQASYKDNASYIDYLRCLVILPAMGGEKSLYAIYATSGGTTYAEVRTEKEIEFNGKAAPFVEDPDLGYIPLYGELYAWAHSGLADMPDFFESESSAASWAQQEKGLQHGEVDFFHTKSPSVYVPESPGSGCQLGVIDGEKYLYQGGYWASPIYGGYTAQPSHRGHVFYSGLLMQTSSTTQEYKPPAKYMYYMRFISTSRGLLTAEGDYLDSIYIPGPIKAEDYFDGSIEEAIHQPTSGTWDSTITATKNDDYGHCDGHSPDYEDGGN